MNRARIISGLLALVSGSVTHADTHPFLSDKFILQAGAFLSRADVNGSVDSATSGENPVIDYSNKYRN